MNRLTTLQRILYNSKVSSMASAQAEAEALIEMRLPNLETCTLADFEAVVSELVANYEAWIYREAE